MGTPYTCKDFTFDNQRFTFIFFTFVKAMVIYFNIVPEFKTNKMRTVIIEKRNKEVSRVIETIDYIAKSAPTKQDAVNRLSDIMSDLKFGWGGSHVWCANQKNERLFIIMGF